MPQAVSTVATLKRTLICAENIPCFNTASGRCCCNGKDYENLYLGFDEFQYRKRQALLQLKMKLVLIIIEKTLVSIPQAVGTVATSANVQPSSVSYSVSIPQAVGTVATQFYFLLSQVINECCFNTASGRHCCNMFWQFCIQRINWWMFQYRKRQALLQPLNVRLELTNCFCWFQYRKRQALLQPKVALRLRHLKKKCVSIPQAVGTVATSET